jgi:hypothetical protein
MRRVFLFFLLVPLSLTACGAGDVDVARQELAITNGMIDTGDEAVVGLVADDRLICTGTLVAPRVVLTAAHCLESKTIDSVLFGADLASGTRIAVAHVRSHPDFDPIALANDVGVVLLADPAPALPLSMIDAPVAMSATVRLVGFGLTTDGSAGGKQTGTATIASVAATTFDLAAAPSLTCAGDSGGPSLIDVGGVEVLAGVTSAGDANCASFTRSTRADVFRTWVESFVTATAEGSAQLGDRCFYAAQCTTGMCARPADAPSVAYCSSLCDRDADCAAGMACTIHQCRWPLPSPGALGASCTTYEDCDSLLCAHVAAGDVGACAIACDPIAAQCASGFSCLEDATQPALYACFPDAPPTTQRPSGCAVDGAARHPSAGILLLLFLVAAATRGIGIGRCRRSLR